MSIAKYTPCLKTEGNFIEIYSMSDEFFPDKCKKDFKDKSGVFWKTAVFSTNTALRKSVNGNENKKVSKVSEKGGLDAFPEKNRRGTKGKEDKKKKKIYFGKIYSLKIHSFDYCFFEAREKFLNLKFLSKAN